ncbi:MAG: HD domain-containing protein, partial [Acidobacteriota bacterium]
MAESLKRQREQLLAENGGDLLGRHTSLLEIAIISLYNRLANRFDLDVQQFRSSGAILAVGAFGRGLIGPGRPVRILVLEMDQLPWQPSWLDEIIQPMTEAGWTVEVDQGSVERLVERAEKDSSFLLDLLESRYISGSRALTDQLEKMLEPIAEMRRDELLERFEKAVTAREALTSDPGFWLEPDLQRYPGGLAEIEDIRIACRIALNIRGFDDAVFRGYLTRPEADLLDRAEKMYVKLLSLLQAEGAGPRTVLRFEEQETLARRLEYSAGAGSLPVESFMQELFQLFYGVKCICREFWERLLEVRYSEDCMEEGTAEVLEEGIFVCSGRILIHTEKHSGNAASLVHLFSLAAKHRLEFASATRRWILHNRNILAEASGDREVRREFLDLLRFDSPELPVVRRFYDLGLMTLLIPQLASVHGLVQHDAFHLYPVHEHHLRTLGELKRLLDGEYAQSEPELTQVAESVTDLTALFLAALLHDIGKGHEESHASAGAAMMVSVGKRLGLNAEECDTVQFLVSQHLLLMDSASLRDLADEEMLSHCALIVGTSEQLDLLLLLSFADMAATGPKARQKWRDTPVIPLCDKVRHILEKGEPSSRAISEKLPHIRSLVAEQIADLMEEAEVERYLDQLAPRYLLSISPGAIARHLRMVNELNRSGEPFAWRVALRDGSAELTVMSGRIPGLLSKVAGVLSLHDINIVGAQVFTMSDGTVSDGLLLLIFQCRQLQKVAGEPEWDAVREDMRRLLLGKFALDYRIAAHASAGSPVARHPARFNPSRILIDNDSSGM